MSVNAGFHLSLSPRRERICYMPIMCAILCIIELSFNAIANPLGIENIMQSINTIAYNDINVNITAFIGSFKLSINNFIYIIFKLEISFYPFIRTFSSFNSIIKIPFLSHKIIFTIRTNNKFR